MSRMEDIARRMADALSRHADYQAVFNTPEGERVLRHLVRVSGMLGSNFVAGDPHATSFKEGQRHIVASILRYTKKDTTQIIREIEKGLDEDA